jgi:hypothetical protein
VQHGFTFGAGPLIRILEHYESGRKTHRRAIAIGVKSIAGAVSHMPRNFQPMLREMHAQIGVDGQPLPYDRFAAVFANVTGVINPFVAPFVSERTRESFHFLAYAVSSREFAMMAPLLARGRLPIDSRTLLHPISTWRQALLSLVGRGSVATDPRYVNRPARELVLETDEPHYTIDGEVFESRDRRFDVRLGRTIELAIMPTRRRAAATRKRVQSEPPATR